jgi:hypothetical protein
MQYPFSWLLWTLECIIAVQCLAFKLDSLLLLLADAPKMHLQQVMEEMQRYGNGVSGVPLFVVRLAFARINRFTIPEIVGKPFTSLHRDK